MADISKLKINNEVYDLKDAEARSTKQDKLTQELNAGANIAIDEDGKISVTGIEVHPTVNIIPVDKLPAEDDADPTAIYMVPNPGVFNRDRKAEYIIIEDEDGKRAWEQFGSTKIDFDFSEVQTKLTPGENITIELDEETQETVISAKGGSESTLIWDNDDDEGLEGKLSKYSNGKITIENIETEYKYLEVYYSELGTSMIQYFKIDTAPLLKEHLEGNKNVGMFYVLKVNSLPLFDLEQVTIEFDKVEDNNYTITVSTLAKDSTKSNIKIERILGGM